MIALKVTEPGGPHSLIQQKTWVLQLVRTCCQSGRESSEHVRRLRAVHIGNADAALKMIWNRLDEYYSSPEVIKSALFKKLDSFPRISGKDNLKLREL